VLQVAQAEAGALQIGTLSAQASSAGGAQVVFSLSQPAEKSRRGTCAWQEFIL